MRHRIKSIYNRLPLWGAFLLTTSIAALMWHFHTALQLNAFGQILLLVMLTVTSLGLIVELISKFVFHFGYEEWMGERRKGQL